MIRLAVAQILSRVDLMMLTVLTTLATTTFRLFAFLYRRLIFNTYRNHNSPAGSSFSSRKISVFEGIVRNRKGATFQWKSGMRASIPSVRDRLPTGDYLSLGSFRATGMEFFQSWRLGSIFRRCNPQKINPREGPMRAREYTVYAVLRPGSWLMGVPTAMSAVTAAAPSSPTPTTMH